MKTFSPEDFEGHFVARLQAMSQEDHDGADEVLMELLSFMGYDRVVETYKQLVQTKKHVSRNMEH